MLGHKTSRQADDQMTFMPLIALGHTFRDSPWATSWVSARARTGLDSKSVLMPAFAEQSRTWLDRPMTSAEGCSWIQEILHGDEFDENTVARVTTHALKATPLSWATKCWRFDKHEKRILGHHSSPDERMIVTYGRDVMCPVLAKLQHVIDLIRAGRFDPDRTRAERMSSMVMRLNEQAEIDVQPERRVEDLRRPRKDLQLPRLAKLPRKLPRAPKDQPPGRRLGIIYCFPLHPRTYCSSTDEEARCCTSTSPAPAPGLQAGAGAGSGLLVGHCRNHVNGEVVIRRRTRRMTTSPFNMSMVYPFIG